MALPSIPQAPALPAHLSDFADFGFSLNESIVGGMKSGGHPSIGIKGGKFRLREGSGDEVIQSFTVDVIIVNANKHLSKVFYEGAYTGEEGKAPDCFSDNGSAPSTQAGKPQCASCAVCSHNQWGSKISPSGAKIKACSDYKKLAVVLADDPGRNVYELRVPGASLKELNAIMTKLINSKIPIPAIVFELGFDQDFDFPKLTFKPKGFADAEQATSVKAWVNSADAKEAVGENDIPAVLNLAGPVAAQLALTQMPQPVAAAYAPPPPAPKQEDPMAFLNAQPQPEQKRGRGRPPRAENHAVPTKEPQQMTFDVPGMQAPAQSTPLNPTTTDKELDDLLAGLMS